jgi:hypothetical protein
MWHHLVKPNTPIFIVIHLLINAPHQKKALQTKKCWVTDILYRQYIILKPLSH